MKSASHGRPGRPPMTEKREIYVRLMNQGMTNTAACRELGIDRKTGHWWKNGGVIARNGIERVVLPILGVAAPRVESGRYLSEQERVAIADGIRAGRSSRSIAKELGRAVSTVARERLRNANVDTGEYRPHAAHQKMLVRRPRPKARKLASDAALRLVVQGYLDQHWSPEQAARTALAEHGMQIATETIYQALYSPYSVLRRDARTTLRTHRNHRRRRNTGESRRGRFVVPIRMIEERPIAALDRSETGHWESQCCCQAARATVGGASGVHVRPSRRSENVNLFWTHRVILITIFNQLPLALRRSLTWDQGVEMCHHHEIAAATGMPVFFCHRASPWQRPTNENTNGLLRDYFPKGTNLRVYGADDLAKVAAELNCRPRKTLNWRSPGEQFATIQNQRM